MRTVALSPFGRLSRALACLACAVLAACSSTSTSSGSGTITATEACNKLVPAACSRNATLACNLTQGDCNTELTPQCASNLAAGASAAKTDACVVTINKAATCEALTTAIGCQ